MTKIPPALAHVCSLRGFAWASEVPPQPSADAGIPVYDTSGRVAGVADIVGGKSDDEFSLFDEISPLTDDQRTAALERLERKEIELLRAVLPSLAPEAAREIVHDDDDTDVDDEHDPGRVLEGSETAFLPASRKQRVAVVERLRGLLRDSQIEEETAATATAHLDEIQALRSTVFRDSIRLAAGLAKEHRHALDFTRAMIAACHGLDIALDRYEPSRGFKFSTYATHWIRQSIGRYRKNQQSALRMPVHVHEALSRFVQHEREQWSEQGRPSTQDILASMPADRRVSPNVVEHLRAVINASSSYAGACFTDQIVDSDIPSLWDGGVPARWPDAALGQIAALIDGVGGKQADRIAEILRARLGLDRPTKTLQELGEDFGITRERIRQLQNKGLTKIQEKLITKTTAVHPWPWRLRT